MSQFEFFMTFYGLLLGLGVAELMGGFANLIRVKDGPKLGLLTPLLGIAVFLQIMATFLDAWRKLQNVTMNLVGLAIPTLIGICFFVIAVVVVPRKTEDWTSLDDYFYDQRRWTVGLLVTVNALIWGYEGPLVAGMFADAKWANIAHYFIANIFLLAAHLTALFARPRWAVAGALAFLIAFFVYYYGDFGAAIFA